MEGIMGLFEQYGVNPFDVVGRRLNGRPLGVRNGMGQRRNEMLNPVLSGLKYRDIQIAPNGPRIGVPTTMIPASLNADQQRTADLLSRNQQMAAQAANQGIPQSFSPIKALFSPTASIQPRGNVMPQANYVNDILQKYGLPMRPQPRTIPI